MLNKIKGYVTSLLLFTALLLTLFSFGFFTNDPVAKATPPNELAQQTVVTTTNLTTPRTFHTTTLLPDGKVLVAGGQFGNATNTITASAEIYNPVTGQWTATGSLNQAREGHTATLLPDGKILIAGGTSSNGVSLASTEIYNPATGTFVQVGALTTARAIHVAVLLPSGKVLVAGGYPNVSTAELYDPVSQTWNPAGALIGGGRDFAAAALLPSGKVLIAGGRGGSSIAFAQTTELYDPITNSWSSSGSMTNPRWKHSLTLLPNGKVLAAGITDIRACFISAKLRNM